MLFVPREIHKKYCTRCIYENSLKNDPLQNDSLYAHIFGCNFTIILRSYYEEIFRHFEKAIVKSVENFDIQPLVVSIC